MPHGLSGNLLQRPATGCDFEQVVEDELVSGSSIGPESPSTLQGYESPSSLQGYGSPYSLQGHESPSSLRGHESPSSLRACSETSLGTDFDFNIESYCRSGLLDNLRAMSSSPTERVLWADEDPEDLMIF